MVNKLKNVKIEKLALIAILSLLLSIQTAMSISVTRPLPIDLKILRGDTERITFEIQALTSQEKLSCAYSVGGLDPLVISFDEKEVVVDAGGIKDVYGSVSVPVDAPIKVYDGSLTLTCSPYTENKDYSGSIMHQAITVRFPIEVVLTKEEKSVNPIPPEIKVKPKASPIILVLIIIILILAIIGFCFTNKKKTV